MDKHLIKHDLVQGLRRKRYLFLPLLFLFPFGTCCYLSRVKEIPGTFLDFLISGFAGIPPVEISLYPPRAAEIPIGWLMSVGGEDQLIVLSDKPIGIAVAPTLEDGYLVQLKRIGFPEESLED